jgi:PAS domain S-box-containing protein
MVMNYDNPRFSTVSQVFISVLVVLIIVSLNWYSLRIDDEHEKVEQLKVESYLKTTNYEISLLINELRRDIQLFARAHRKEINQLAENNELTDVHDQLVEQLKMNFRHAFAITLANNHGEVLLEDFDGYVQGVCEREIKQFSDHMEHSNLVVHPNPLGYHFDLMTTLDNVDEVLIVFVSFHVDAVSEILQRDILYGYRTIISNKSKQDLIEITAAGSRDKMSGDHFIGPALKNDRVDTASIADSEWVLGVYRDRDVGDIYSSVRKETNWVIFGFLIVGLSTLLVLQKFKVQLVRHNALIKSQSEDIKQSSERLEAIFSSVLDGIVTIDQKGTIRYFNAAAQDIFGYSLEEVEGENVSMLMPDPYHREHDQYLKNYHESHVPKVIGIGREVKGKRKDGSTFPMDLSVAEVRHGNDVEFVGTVRDITERKRVATMKDEFISTVSHELRTPLTSIRGSLGLIHGGKLGEIPEKIGKLLDIAISNTDRLVRLINDILDIEKIESGKMHFEFREHLLESIIARAIETTSGMAEANNIAVDYVPGEVRHVVNIDEDRLIQVVVNLLSNAIKFSDTALPVHVKIDDKEGHVCVEVRNRGRGIRAGDRSKIFQKFSQVDSSDSREKGGSGLGLSISKTIVEKHGGSIGFTSEPGKETVFFFKLPYHQPDIQPLVDDEADVSVNRMLIVEDDPDVAHLLSIMLSQQHIASDIAHDAVEAKRLLARHEYIGATLDLMLPGQDGISLYRYIRANKDTAELPIIIVSAKANDSKKDLNGDAVYIIDWMNKPIDQERLYELLSMLVERKDSAKTKILHVEDDEEHAILVHGILSDVGEIVNCATVIESKKRLSDEYYDLVILDLNLPDGTGMEVFEILKRTRNANVPVIVFSADEMTTDRYETVVTRLVKATSTNEELADAVRNVVDNK